MGMELLDALCANEDIRCLLESVTRLALSREAPVVWARFRLPILQLYEGIADLAARQPMHQGQPVIGTPQSWEFCGSDVLFYKDVSDQRMTLKRHKIIDQLAFLVQPPHGLAFIAMQEGEQRESVREAAIKVIASSIAVPGNFLVQTKTFADHLIRIHFLAFAKLYHGYHGCCGQRNILKKRHALCKAHLQVLGRLSAFGDFQIRQQFFHLHVIDFLLRELSLESDIKQLGALPGVPHSAGEASTCTLVANAMPSPTTPPSVSDIRICTQYPGQILGQATVLSPQGLALNYECCNSETKLPSARHFLSRTYHSKDISLSSPVSPLVPLLGSIIAETRVGEGLPSTDIVSTYNSGGLAVPPRFSRGSERKPPIGPGLRLSLRSAQVHPMAPSPRNARLSWASPRSTSRSPEDTYAHKQEASAVSARTTQSDLPSSEVEAVDSVPDGDATTIVRGADHRGEDAQTQESQYTSSLANRDALSPSHNARFCSLTDSYTGNALVTTPRECSSQIIALEDEQEYHKGKDRRPFLPTLRLLTPDVDQVTHPELLADGDHSTSEAGAVNQISVMYAHERAERPIYHDQELLLLVLELVFRLILTHSGDLDPLYCSTLPQDTRRPHVFHVLGSHFSHESNVLTTASFYSRCAKLGLPALRAFRLLWPALFLSDLYATSTQIARGLHTEVYECHSALVGEPSDLAMKVVDLPALVHDPCSQVSIFNEVTILERLQGMPGVCQLYDYGVCATSAALIMKRYAFSLRTWRERLPPDPSPLLRLYLRIFSDILARVKVLGIYILPILTLSATTY
eukprot:jgi/Botrbrau1/40/Bobra.0022s0034.2